MIQSPFMFKIRYFIMLKTTKILIWKYWLFIGIYWQNSENMGKFGVNDGYWAHIVLNPVI